MTSLASPLVDGYCREYAALGVTPIQASEDVQLFFYQDAHYVWTSYY